MIDLDGRLPSQPVLLSDLDGVLVDSAAAVERAWTAWALRRGLDVDDVLALAHGRPTVEVVAAAAPHLDTSVEAAEVEGEEVADTEGLTALPGAADLLGAVPRVALVTSGTRALASSRLAATGLSAPDVLVTADQIDRGKPHPEPYLTAAERLGASPAECLVVEDAPAGVAAGLAAGMTVVALRTTHDERDLVGAHAVVDDARDVVRWLRARQ
jgi:mannitol-1-/sugar-/sorbitol-6-phosphatase